jgi:prohibitin 2
VIAQTISNTLSARNIVVETVFITDFKFSQAFANQVESEVVAFQKFLAEQNNLKAMQVIANQAIVQAQATARANGESQAIKVITVQLKQSPQYHISINRWNGQMPYALNNGAVPFFQLPLSRTPQNQTKQ